MQLSMHYISITWNVLAAFGSIFGIEFTMFRCEIHSGKYHKLLPSNKVVSYMTSGHSATLILHIVHFGFIAKFGWNHSIATGLLSVITSNKRSAHSFSFTIVCLAIPSALHCTQNTLLRIAKWRTNYLFLTLAALLSYDNRKACKHTQIIY